MDFGALLGLGADLTLGGELCKAKALLAFLSPSADPLDSYELYLSTSVLVDNDQHLASLSARPGLRRQFLKHQFKSAAPRSEPQFFSFFSPQCLDRLGKCLGVELVFYRLDRRDGAHGAKFLIPFVDFRPGTLSGGSRPRTQGFVFGDAGSCGELRAADLDKLDACFTESWLTPIAGLTIKSLSRKSKQEVFSKVFWDLLKQEPWPQELRFGTPGNLPTVSIEEPGDLLLDPKAGHALWSLLKIPVLVVSFESLTLAGKRDKRRQKARSNRLIIADSKKWNFKVLAFAGPAETAEKISELEGLESAAVVAFWGRYLCSTLAEGLASRIKAKLRSTSGNAERLFNRSFRQFLPTDSQARRRKLDRLSEARSERAKRLDALKKWCQCSLCTASKYDANMSKAGPERLVVTPYTPAELMKMLGLWSEDESAELLEKVCELSLASMDIESRTVSVDLAGPRPGPYVPYAEVDDESSLEAHVLKVQKPIMIAHLDGRGSAFFFR